MTTEYNPNGIPDYLKSLPIWALSAPNQVNYFGAPFSPKAPLFPVEGKDYCRGVKPTDPTEWRSFDEVDAQQDLLGGYPGLMVSNGFIGIDFDLEKASPEYVAWFESAVLPQVPNDAHCERSPSGVGYRIIVKGTIPVSRKTTLLEIYNKHRFLRMTGAVVERVQSSEFPALEPQVFIDWLYAQVQGADAEDIAAAEFDFDTTALPSVEEARLVYEKVLALVHEGDRGAIEKADNGEVQGSDAAYAVCFAFAKARLTVAPEIDAETAYTCLLALEGIQTYYQNKYGADAPKVLHRKFATQWWPKVLAKAGDKVAHDEAEAALGKQIVANLENGIREREDEEFEALGNLPPVEEYQEDDEEGIFRIELPFYQEAARLLFESDTFPNWSFCHLAPTIMGSHVLGKLFHDSVSGQLVQSCWFPIAPSTAGKGMFVKLALSVSQWVMTQVEEPPEDVEVNMLQLSAAAVASEKKKILDAARKHYRNQRLVKSAPVSAAKLLDNIAEQYSYIWAQDEGTSVERSAIGGTGPFGSLHLDLNGVFDAQRIGGVFIGGEGRHKDTAVRQDRLEPIFTRYAPLHPETIASTINEEGVFNGNAGRNKYITITEEKSDRYAESFDQINRMPPTLVAAFGRTHLWAQETGRLSSIAVPYTDAAKLRAFSYAKVFLERSMQDTHSMIFGRAMLQVQIDAVHIAFWDTFGLRILADGAMPTVAECVALRVDVRHLDAAYIINRNSLEKMHVMALAGVLGGAINERRVADLIAPYLYATLKGEDEGSVTFSRIAGAKTVDKIMERLRNSRGETDARGRMAAHLQDRGICQLQKGKRGTSMRVSRKALLREFPFLHSLRRNNH